MRDEELVLPAEKTRLVSAKGRTSKAVILGASPLAFILVAIALSPVTPAANAGSDTPLARG